MVFGAAWAARVLPDYGSVPSAVSRTRESRRRNFSVFSAERLATKPER